MVPSFTLRNLSPARTTLSIPQSSTPDASTSTSPARSLPTSPAGSSTSLSKDNYFNLPSRAPPPAISRDEAFKTAKAVEGVLGAWNEYRIAFGVLGKAGRKLASAIKELVGLMDKTQVPSQTLRPTSAMLETVSDITVKLAKKIDNEYDEANSDASKYFTLLTKETKAHEAYLGAIGKKHDKAEKVYRKAAKGLSDTSGAHTGLLALKETLSKDIEQAQLDHTTLLGNKQSILLFKLAASAHILSSSLTSYFSEGLRRSGSSHKDIEYFGTLADIRWQGFLPSDLEDVDEMEKRDGLRLMKTRVALGEREMIGPEVWAGIKVGVGERSDQLVIQTVALKAVEGESRVRVGSDLRIDPPYQPSPSDKVDKLKAEASKAMMPVTRSAIPSQEKSTELHIAPRHAYKEENLSRPQPRHTDSKTSIHTSSTTSSQLTSGDGSNAWIPQTPPSRTDRWHPSNRNDTASLRREPWLNPLRTDGVSKGESFPYLSDQLPLNEGRHDQMFKSPERSYREPGMVGSYPSPHHEPNVPPVHSTQTLRSSSIAIPKMTRSISQIARELESRSNTIREASFQAHQSHIDGYVRDCQLCSMDYDRMLGGVNTKRPTDLRNLRRVTMPPAYCQPEVYLPPGAGMTRPSMGYESRTDRGEEMAAPRPQRVVRVTPDFEEYRHGQ